MKENLEKYKIFLDIISNNVYNCNISFNDYLEEELSYDF